MITKFTESIRRNQKQWMVVITILAVFAFVFDDTMRSQQGAGIGSIIMIAGLCAAGMAIVGYPRQKTTEFALAGLIVGGFVAFISTNAAKPAAAVRTSIGNFNGDDLNALREQRRSKASRFLNDAVSRIDKDGRAPSFGGYDAGSMVSYAVMHSEAKRMGISVSDDAVNEFIRKATQGKLTQADFNAALREAKLHESDLFNILRGELEVQLVAQLTGAPADAQPITGWRMAQQTPEQLWQTFRKLHVRQGVSLVALPVTEFVKIVPEPTEAELKEFFEKHKNGYGDERGTPGFLVPPKVQLAYLVASTGDLSKVEGFEKQAAAISDQQVVDYYNSHKELYRVVDIPEPSGTNLPDLSRDPAALDAKPADATNAENVDLPATPEAKSETKEQSEEKEATKPDAPSKDGDAKSESPKGGTPCDDAVTEEKKEVEQKQDATNPEPDSKDKPEAKPVDALKPPAPALPTDEAVAAEKSSQAEVPADTSTPKGSSLLNSLPMPPPAPRYRELDDDLKDQIREAILRDRAFAEMGRAADNAEGFMMELSLKYLSAEKNEREKLAKTFVDQLKDYATKNGLEYKETAAMSQMDLIVSLDEKIGSATDPNPKGGGFNRDARSVAEEVFEQSGSGRGYQLSLFSPRRADSLSGSRYCYWKTREVAPQIADLKDEEVRKKVVDAWKFEKARGLAEKRAKELADLMKQGASDLPAALSGQTINGTPDSPAATIRETPKFTWLRLPQSLPQFGLQRPAPSQVEGVEQAGYEFMKTVFDDLGNGDTGVTINHQKTILYAVRVHDRDAAGVESEGVASLETLQKQYLRERFNSFMPTPYEFMAAEVQNSVDGRWRNNFTKRFGIVFDTTSSAMDDE